MTKENIVKNLWDGVLVTIVTLFILGMFDLEVDGIKSFLGVMVLFVAIHWHRGKIADMEERLNALNAMFIYIARTTDIFNKFKTSEQLREEAEEKTENEPS